MIFHRQTSTLFPHPQIPWLSNNQGFYQRMMVPLGLCLWPSNTQRYCQRMMVPPRHLRPRNLRFILLLNYLWLPSSTMLQDTPFFATFTCPTAHYSSSHPTVPFLKFEWWPVSVCLLMGLPKISLPVNLIFILWTFSHLRMRRRDGAETSTTAYGIPYLL